MSLWRFPSEGELQVLQRSTEYAKLPLPLPTPDTNPLHPELI